MVIGVRRISLADRTIKIACFKQAIFLCEKRCVGIFICQKEGKSGRPIPQILSALAGRITITLSGLLGCERGQRMNRLGLAPCGVYHAAFVTKRAVRSYRTFSPLPLRAVYFLRHFPSGRSFRLPARPFKRRIAVRSPEVPPPNPRGPGAVIWPSL